MPRIKRTSTDCLQSLAQKIDSDAEKRLTLEEFFRKLLITEESAEEAKDQSESEEKTVQKLLKLVVPKKVTAKPAAKKDFRSFLKQQKNQAEKEK